MEDTRVITRRVDNGDPLLLWNPPGEGAIAAYAVSAGACGNPECSCTRIELAIQEARIGADGVLRFGGPAIKGEACADDTGLTIREDTAIFTAAATQWIRERLNDEENRDWLVERWGRLRGQIGDARYPPGIPPDVVDELIPFFEVFPADFDLTTSHEGRLYLADDYYCLDPECACDDAVVLFNDLSTEDNQDPGSVRVSIRHLRVISIEGTPIARTLWNRLLEDYGAAQFHDRFRRMRDVALTRARPTRHSARPIAGRNAQCPCGSGKKFKRCCGA